MHPIDQWIQLQNRRQFVAGARAQGLGTAALRIIDDPR